MLAQVYRNCSTKFPLGTHPDMPLCRRGGRTRSPRHPNIPRDPEVVRYRRRLRRSGSDPRRR